MRASIRICRLLPVTAVALAGCLHPVTPADEEMPPTDPGLVLDARPGSGTGSTFAWKDGSQSLIGIEQRGPSQGAPLLEIDLTTFGVRHVSVGTGSHVAVHVASESDAVYLMGQDGNRPSYVKRLDAAGGDPALVADGLSSQEFLVSRNDRWVLFRSARSWHVMDRVTARRTELADTTLIHPLAMSDDGRDAVFHAVCRASPGYCLAAADFEAGVVRQVTVLPADAMLVAAAFVDGSLRLIWVRRDAASPARSHVLEEWDGGSGAVTRVGMTTDPVGGCLAWSWERRVAVGMVYLGTRGWPAITRMRIDLITNDGSRPIGSVDLRGNGNVSECQLSPDGRWYLYGDPTGYRGEGTLYLKAVPSG